MKQGKSGLPFVFDKRLFIYLFLSFILFSVALIITHEGGHYIAMRELGYKNARIHYTFTDTGRNEIRAEHHAIHMHYKEAIDKHLPFPEEKRYNELGRQIDTMIAIYDTKIFDEKEAIMYAAGPSENMLTGAIGVLLLFLFSNHFRQAEKLRMKQWVIVFVALCWLGVVDEFFAVLIQGVIRGNRHMRTDGYKVSIHFGLYPWTFDIIAGILGVLAIWITIRFVPAAQRVTLLIALIIGSVAGKLLWDWLGPLVLP